MSSCRSTQVVLLAAVFVLICQQAFHPVPLSALHLSTSEPAAVHHPLTATTPGKANQPERARPHGPEASGRKALPADRGALPRLASDSSLTASAPLSDPSRRADVSTPAALRRRLAELQLGLGGDGTGGGCKTIIASTHIDVEQNVLSWGASPGRKASALRLDASIVQRLPAADYASDGSRRFESCALVGNAGSILHSGHGPEIDGHEAVMRINYAPIRAFSADVGTKTTFDFSNRENARRLLESRSVQWRRPPSTIVLFEIASPTNRRAIFQPLLRAQPSLDIHFVHPDFLERASQLWFDLKAEIERRNGAHYHDKPMSGWTATLLLMQMCRSVDLYGFESYTSKRLISTPYHYFDAVAGVTSVHSFDFAIEAFKRLGEVARVTVR